MCQRSVPSVGVIIVLREGGLTLTCNARLVAVAMLGIFDSSHHAITPESSQSGSYDPSGANFRVVRSQSQEEAFEKHCRPHVPTGEVLTRTYRGGRLLRNHRSQLLGREVGILSLGAPGGSRGRRAFFRRFWGGGREGGYRGRRRPRRRQPRCEALRWTLRQRELRARKREQRQRNLG